MESSRKSPSTELPPAALQAAVGACLQRHVAKDGRLVLGLSGGIDSVCLLHALLAVRGPDRLSALHVHHGISPNADAWAAFCRDLCVDLGVPCRVEHVAVERGSADGLEAAARRARHAVFAAVDTDWLVLAHHRDDQSETLLFNLLRGCGVAGAAAMRECNGRLLRPLLGIGRDAIVSYARAANLAWCDDESNADVRHTRNFLRQRVFPLLTERFPAAAENFAQAAERFGEAGALLDALAQSDLPDGVEDFPLPVAALAQLAEPRARNVLRHLLARHHVMIPSEKRLREALRQMLAAGIDRHPAVTLGNYRLLRRQKLIYLEPVADSN